VVRAIRKPVVAALQGWTLGGGAEMSLGADIRIAADTTRFGFPEVQRGWVGGGGASQLLPRLIGHAAATRLLMLAEQIDAAEALRLGMVHEVVSSAELLARARAVAAQLAGFSPVAVQSVKAALRAAMESPLSAGLTYENEMNVLCFSAGDHLEGIRAFNEKRQADFVR
jgi:enoyl-CoA hydratase/carnithine racemase